MLCESGLVFRLGSGKDTAYRAATSEELAQLRGRTDGLDELAWVIIYRDGPLGLEHLLRLLSTDDASLTPALERLLADGRVSRDGAGNYRSANVVLPVGSSTGWEAAMFDHFQSVVTTLCARLRSMDDEPSPEVGGSTYGFNVWPGHPYEAEVRAALADFRKKYTRLREQVQEHNARQGLPEHYQKVVVYGGQYSVEHEPDGPDG